MQVFLKSMELFSEKRSTEMIHLEKKGGQGQRRSARTGSGAQLYKMQILYNIEK